MLSVDSTGISLRGRDDVVLDVLFDDRRIWSFWSRRDTAAAGSGGADERRADWPQPLRKYLDGQTRLMIRSHVAEDVAFDADVTFGDGAGRVAVVNGNGVALSLDKSGRMQATFDTRSAADVTPLLDSIDEVVSALGRAGIEAFPAYGTLLGAVRDGALIGHDSDADLGYVSSFSHPADVVRESFVLQRALTDMGYQVMRYSGAGFQVQVAEPDGNKRGLDVFGGYLDDGRLILLGEVRLPYEREWIFPLGTTHLEGRALPAPAEPDKLLAAMYGPSWRTPDPAFQFTTPVSTTKRLNDWFRGTTVNRAGWDRSYQSRRFNPPTGDPSTLARFVARQESRRDDPATLTVDVGCGRGLDARWLARRGHRTLGLDYSPRGYEYVEREVAADEPDLPVSFGSMNLLELRSTLAHGARVGATPGRHVVMARQVANAMPAAGRHHLWRFLELACHGGGRAYLEFLTSPDADDRWAQRNVIRRLDPERVAAEIAERGGTVVSTRTIGSRRMGITARRDTFREQRRSCRMVVEWTR